MGSGEPQAVLAIGPCARAIGGKRPRHLTLFRFACLLLALDLAVLIAAALCAAITAPGLAPSRLAIASFVAMTAALPVLVPRDRTRLERRRRDPVDAGRVFGAAALGALGFGASLVMLPGAADAAPVPEAASAWFVATSLGLVALRSLASMPLARAGRDGRLATRVVVIGDTGCADALLDRIATLPRGAVEVLARIPDQPEPGPGRADPLLTRCRADDVDAVLLAVPPAEPARLRALVRRVESVVADLHVVVEPAGLAVAPTGEGALDALPLLTVARRPLGLRARAVKRVFDVTVSAVLLLALAPLMLAVALLIRAGSPGPALFRQRRVGFNNREFTILKFRTMRHDAEPVPGAMRQARRDDPRVTALGRTLRRLSIDELPQLLNVLRGDMSLVGPRPHASSHMLGGTTLDAVVDAYAIRHRVRPGLTGWAQAHGVRGEFTTVADVARRVELDLHYVRHWSFALDLRILLRTACKEILSATAF